MASLKNSIWQFKQDIDAQVIGEDDVWYITFESDNTDFNLMVVVFDILWYGTPQGGITTTAYDVTDKWSNQAYRTIKITGGEDVHSQSLRTFLESAAVLVQAGDPEVECKVNGTWKKGEPKVKVNGTWKDADSMLVKVDGAWKESV